MENLTLKDEIRKLNENFQELVKKKEAKKFRLPWKARVSKKRAKEGYAGICYINENRSVNFMKVPIKEGTIIINGTPHLATTDYMLNFKNKPFLIVPSWNTEPFSPVENLEEATANKKTTYGYRLLLNTLKSEQLETKKKVGTAIIILIILAILAGGYYLLKGGI